MSTFPLKAALLSTAAAAVISLAVALPAAAATPCWQAVINDWVDGRIDGTYPVNCYRQAIPHLPADLRIYSSAEEDSHPHRADARDRGICSPSARSALSG